MFVGCMEHYVPGREARQYMSMRSPCNKMTCCQSIYGAAWENLLRPGKGIDEFRNNCEREEQNLFVRCVEAFRSSQRLVSRTPGSFLSHACGDSICVLTSSLRRINNNFTVIEFLAVSFARYSVAEWLYIKGSIYANCWITGTKELYIAENWKDVGHAAMQ